MQLTAVCFILLVSCLGATHGDDCGLKMYTGMGQCFRSEGIELPTGNESVRLTQTQTSETMCRQIGAYKNAVGCAMDFARKCLRVVGMEGILPDITGMRKGMDFLCQKSKDFDYHCMTNKVMDNQQCFTATLKGLQQRYQEENRVPTRNEITCTAADIIYDCSALQLKNCPKLTKAVFLELLNKHLVPSVCEDKPPGRPRKSYVKGGAASLTPFFNPFRAMVVSMATLIFLRWSG